MAAGGSIAFNPRENNFDLIRLIAAFMVVFAHVYSLTGAPSDPLSALLHYGYSGTLGVMVFSLSVGFWSVGPKKKTTPDNTFFLAACASYPVWRQ
jgi:peptidoglycan/LPS O-acetylase OafA/YrhL